MIKNSCNIVKDKIKYDHTAKYFLKIMVILLKFTVKPLKFVKFK